MSDYKTPPTKKKMDYWHNIVLDNAKIDESLEVILAMLPPSTDHNTIPRGYNFDTMGLTIGDLAVILYKLQEHNPNYRIRVETNWLMAFWMEVKKP